MVYFGRMLEPMEMADLLGAAETLDSVSRTGPQALTEKQRKFAALFVANGGNAVEAAKGAGYAQPDSASVKLRCNKRLTELIQLLALVDVSAQLPAAIKVLWDIAQDEKQSADVRRKCALDLVKIAGAMPTGAPMLALQVNQTTGAVAGDAGSTVTATLQAVWDRRRLRLSSIDAPMQDSGPTDVAPPASTALLEG